MFITCGVCDGQILCIYCYDQNDTISANVNNLILNGGFENGCGNTGFFCPNASAYTCDITNWTCTGGGSSTYAHTFDAPSIWISIVVEGTRAVYFGNQNSLVCSPTPNDTTCLLNADCAVSGITNGYPTSGTNYGGTLGVSLEQIVSGLVIGNTYVLEFWVGGEWNTINNYAGPGLFAVNLGFGDTLLRDKPTPISTGIGTRYIIEFIANSSSHTIKFTNWGHMCSYCTELVLDDVRLYTLTELDTSVPHCTVGIVNPDLQNEVNLFPNPVTSELNLKTNRTELSEFFLYDITSRKLLQQSFSNTISINTEQLAKGIYLYEVRNKDGVIKKGKVVKE